MTTVRELEARVAELERELAERRGRSQGLSAGAQYALWTVTGGAALIAIALAVLH